jgi:YgiT-type zinc finger domain-containing protein
MNKKCNFCRGVKHEERRTDYLYSYKGNCLLVPNTPVEVCQTCGMMYYPAKVLKDFVGRFGSIYANLH